MCGWFSDARILASRRKRATLSASWVKASDRTLRATSAIQLRVPGAVHLAHAALAELAGHLVQGRVECQGLAPCGRNRRDYTRMRGLSGITPG